MLKVIIVEDDDVKATQVADVCKETVDVDLTIVETVYDAGQKLKSNQYDLMVLDVKLPMRPGDSVREDAGIKLLQHLKTRKEFKIPFHVIGLTAHEEKLNEYKKQFEDFTWILMYYDTSSDLWVKQLTNGLIHVANVNNIEKQKDYQTDLAIVTALQSPELDQVLMLEGNWQQTSISGDDTLYYRGEFKSCGKTISVIAASAIQAGMTATTGLAMKICQHFKPKYIAMTGIAAGVRGNFGDILIADQSWDYGSGKIKLGIDNSQNESSIFEPAPTAIRLSPKILEEMQAFLTNDHILKQIELDWDGVRAATPLSALIGPIASGAAVIENRNIIDAIKAHDRKLVGVEMEIYGLFLASLICPGPRPTAMAFKSICDFGDSEKSDDYQNYAAYTSSNFLYHFALSVLAK